MVYDVIVVGGGPAGLTAGIYLARAKLKAVILEKLAPGGQVIITTKVENYPGFPEGINGPELMFLFEQQVRRLGVEIEQAFTVHEIKVEDSKKIIIGEGEKLEAKAVIIATGARFKKLGVPGEEEFTGRGVSYCATCDAPFYQGLDVAVVGGGDTAIVEALHLTKFAQNVFVIHRRDALRAAKILQEEAFRNEKVKFIWNTVVKEIKGEITVEKLLLEDVKTGEQKELEVQGCFIFIGTEPNSELVKGLVELDERGYIITDSYCQTSVPGIFAAGDVRKSPVKQIATAVGDGAIAAIGAEKYLNGWKM